ARALGALPTIWRLQSEFTDDNYAEELLHKRLAEQLPSYAALLQTIQAYERFCRGLHDGFDLLRSEVTATDPQGFEVSSIGRDSDFVTSLSGLERRYEEARQRLGEIDLQLLNLFDVRFGTFAEQMSPGDCAMALCEHHEKVQKGKSADG